MVSVLKFYCIFADIFAFTSRNSFNYYFFHLLQLVKSLSPETFKKTISKDHHFVEFYTPWCEHCKTMAPRLEDLAEGLRNDKTVTVAKVVDEFRIHGYHKYLFSNF